MYILKNTAKLAIFAHITNTPPKSIVHPPRFSAFPIPKPRLLHLKCSRGVKRRNEVRNNEFLLFFVNSLIRFIRLAAICDYRSLNEIAVAGGGIWNRNILPGADFFVNLRRKTTF